MMIGMSIDLKIIYYNINYAKKEKNSNRRIYG